MNLVTKQKGGDLLQSINGCCPCLSALAWEQKLSCCYKECQWSPEKCQVMRKSVVATHSVSQRCLTKEEALTNYVDAKSTGHSYKLGSGAWHMVFPSFYCVRQAKAKISGTGLIQSIQIIHRMWIRQSLDLQLHGLSFVKVYLAVWDRWITGSGIPTGYERLVFWIFQLIVINYFLLQSCC